MQPLTPQCAQCGPTQTSSQRRARSSCGGGDYRPPSSLCYQSAHAACLRHIHRPSISLHSRPEHEAHNCDLSSRGLPVFTSWRSHQNERLQEDQRAVWIAVRPLRAPLWSSEPSPGSAAVKNGPPVRLQSSRCDALSRGSPRAEARLTVERRRWEVSRERGPLMKQMNVCWAQRDTEVWQVFASRLQSISPPSSDLQVESVKLGGSERTQEQGRYPTVWLSPLKWSI